VTERKQRQKKTQFVRPRRSVVGFASKEEKTLLTRPASLEIPRLLGLNEFPDSATESCSAALNWGENWLRL
jgi:hypothetical protein